MKRKKIQAFVTTLAATFVVWTVLLLMLPYSAWAGLVVKLVVWGAFSLIVLKQHDLDVKSIVEKESSLKWVGMSLLLLVIYLLAVNKFRLDYSPLSLHFVVSAILISPVIEEFVFKVVVQNFTSQLIGEIKGNIFASILFVVYHIPLWLYRGNGVAAMNCLWVLVFSLWVGFAFNRTRSMKTCVVIHLCHNIVLGLFLS